MMSELNVRLPAGVSLVTADCSPIHAFISKCLGLLIWSGDALYCCVIETQNLKQRLDIANLGTQGGG